MTHPGTMTVTVCPKNTSVRATYSQTASSACSVLPTATVTTTLSYTQQLLCFTYSSPTSAARFKKQYKSSWWVGRGERRRCVHSGRDVAPHHTALIHTTRYADTLPRPHVPHHNAETHPRTRVWRSALPLFLRLALDKQQRIVDVPLNDLKRKKRLVVMQLLQIYDQENDEWVVDGT